MKKREGRVSLKRKQSLARHGNGFGFHLKYKRNHRRISSGVGKHVVQITFLEDCCGY